MISQFAGSGCLALTLGLAGCIVIPIPTGEDKVLEGRPVEESQLAFLAPGVTTRDEVLQHFGQPHVYWEDARIASYDWEMRSGILLWAVGGYGGAAAGIGELEKHYLFLVEYDDAARVRRFQRACRPWSTTYPDFLRQWKAAGDQAAETQPLQQKP